MPYWYMLWHVLNLHMEHQVMQQTEITCLAGLPMMIHLMMLHISQAFRYV